MISCKGNSGFTLIEVIMVIVILGIMASIAMKSMDTALQTTRIEETKAELRLLANAIAGNPDLYSNGVRTDYGYVGDVGSLPGSLDDLVSNPGYTTWNGPYVKSAFSGYDEDFKQDAWGRNYVYGGTTILSTGGGLDTLEYLLASNPADYTGNTVAGTVTDALGNPPGDSSIMIRIILSYPNGAGSYRDSTIEPSSSGYFTFSSTVPIGNHTIRAVYTSTNDTVITFVSVPPKSTVVVNLKLPGSLWSDAEQFDMQMQYAEHECEDVYAFDYNYGFYGTCREN